MSWFHSRDRTYTGRQYTAERGDGYLSLVRQLLGPRYGRRQQLRFHVPQAMFGDAVGQWRHLRSKSLVSALSTTADLFAAHTALTS